MVECSRAGEKGGCIYLVPTEAERGAFEQLESKELGAIGFDWGTPEEGMVIRPALLGRDGSRDYVVRPAPRLLVPFVASDPGDPDMAGAIQRYEESVRQLHASMEPVRTELPGGITDSNLESAGIQLAESHVPLDDADAAALYTDGPPPTDEELADYDRRVRAGEVTPPIYEVPPHLKPAAERLATQTPSGRSIRWSTDTAAPDCVVANAHSGASTVHDVQVHFTIRPSSLGRVLKRWGVSKDLLGGGIAAAVERYLHECGCAALYRVDVTLSLQEGCPGGYFGPHSCRLVLSSRPDMVDMRAVDDYNALALSIAEKSGDYARQVDMSPRGGTFESRQRAAVEDMVCRWVPSEGREIVMEAVDAYRAVRAPMPELKAELADLRRIAISVKAAPMGRGMARYVKFANDLADAVLAYCAEGAPPKACPSYEENGAEYERLKRFHALEVSQVELALKRELDAARNATNEAYNERNQLAAFLARMYPSGHRKTNIPGWDPEWHGCVFIDLPTGQVSWHYHDREAGLFETLPAYTKPWDGHTTAEKYTRLANFRNCLSSRSGPLPTAGHPRFHDLLAIMGDMHSKKNSDYARKADSMSNFRMCEGFGVEAWRGAMVRMSDKWARLTVLATKDKPSVSDETFEDTLMDLAAYALLVRILREEQADRTAFKPIEEPE